MPFQPRTRRIIVASSWHVCSRTRRACHCRTRQRVESKIPLSLGRGARSRRSWHVEATGIHRPFQRRRTPSIPPPPHHPSPPFPPASDLIRCVRFGACENDPGTKSTRESKARGMTTLGPSVTMVAGSLVSDVLLGEKHMGIISRVSYPVSHGYNGFMLIHHSITRD